MLTIFIDDSKLVFFPLCAIPHHPYFGATTSINAFLKDAICRKTLAEITSHDFENYKQNRLKTVLGSTVNREFNIIRHAYNTAINVWELPISKNPLNSLKKAPTPQSRIRRLTQDEQERLFDQCTSINNQYIRPVIRFALETGMRRSEILAIKFEHVNFDKSLLHIPKTKTGYPRTIPLSQKALEAIGKPKKKGHPFPIHVKSLEYYWRHICIKGKLLDLHFHDLRHEAISRFFERGLSIPEVALISGHRDYRMLARYTHLRAEDVAKKL